MAAWKYIKGSEKDFLGAPEWATMRTFTGGCAFFTEKHARGGRIWDIARKNEFAIETDEIDESDIRIIAQRERVTSIEDEMLAADLERFKRKVHERFQKPDNVNPKYNRPCKGMTIDVYDVLQAFNVTNPALQHLVKKALAVGQRGHKDKMEDLRDILASAQRAIELEEGEGK